MMRQFLFRSPNQSHIQRCSCSNHSSKMYLLPLFIVICASPIAISDLWDYEPSFWSVEGDDFEFDLDESGNQDITSQSSAIEQPGDQHLRHNFLNSELLQNKQQPKEENCTQFWVDTREAIVCDSKRCDKLEFQWPQQNNQISLIESTRHGMRFHQAKFKFASTKSNIEKETTVQSHLNREKFDIFDLFKPKPPHSFTSSTTTAAPSTSTNLPETTTFVSSSPSQDQNATELVTTLRLDTRRKKQKMVGFGGALSDSTCRNIKSLSSDMAKSLMEDYYGDKGLKYNIVRMTMGSSDFSTTPYTNNDQSDSDKEDLEMKNFHLTEEDYNYKLPVARQAIATSGRELKFFASLWSPPIWMKNNSNIVHGYLKGDVFGPYYKALAELMIKWLEAYRENGIDFWAVTGLNEPVTGTKPFIFHNSLGMTKDDYIVFFKLYLGPMMRRRGLQNVKIIMLDDNKGYAPKWVRAMLEDQEAAKYISGIGIHWYMNDEYENLNFIEKNYPDKFVLSTEACNGFLPFQVHPMPGDWDRGVAYMYDILKVIQKNSVGWVDWNMALDLRGGPSWAKNNLDSAIIVNAKRDEYYKSPMFYAIGHFSHFVEPGSSRLEQRLAYARFDYPLEVVAFHTLNDYIVIVALNANKHSVPLKIIVDKQLIRMITLRADSFNTIVFKWKSKYK